jgi:hypothetical protein
MLTKADDYPIHQLPVPIAYAGTDRNFYDRYFFNAYSKDGSVFVAAAMGIYPHLNIIDGSFCVWVEGKQHNVHVSRILGMERMDTRVGPLSVEVIEPLTKLRVKLDKNEYGLTGDITFTKRAPPVEEPRFIYQSGPRTTMDYTRLTQNGTYEGWVEVDGKRIELKAADTWGTRDRSWGVRPVGAGDSQPVAPQKPFQFYWLWGPCNFDDCFTLYHNNAEASGEPWNEAAVMGMAGDHEPVHMKTASSSVVFKPGTRHAKSAVAEFADRSGKSWKLSFAPKWQFYMAGLGYLNSEWGHGHFKGENAIGFELFETDKVNENAFDRLHVQAFSTVTLEGDDGSVRQGSGVLEQLIIGPHAPSGFKELLDLAP